MWPSLARQNEIRVNNSPISLWAEHCLPHYFIVYMTFHSVYILDLSAILPDDGLLSFSLMIQQCHNEHPISINILALRVGACLLSFKCYACQNKCVPKFPKILRDNFFKVVISFLNSYMSLILSSCFTNVGCWLFQSFFNLLSKNHLLEIFNFHFPQSF